MVASRETLQDIAAERQLQPATLERVIRLIDILDAFGADTLIGPRVALTGIPDPALLRASHIIPWSECDSDAERLDVHNGLLLSALWDAAFDRALVTFDDEGEPEFSPCLSEQARAELRWSSPISLTDEHRRRLARHRERARGASGGRESPSGAL